MTAQRVIENRKPGYQPGPLLPMADEDRAFWRLFRERRTTRQGDRT